ncbi:hypothetical protein L3Y34_019880 [Caenorhabditis briggsae]|uniref:Uncharacterized protein n=2 Tax=Caenorhabditis briggsae TaxID=6238 RepID=A0AAE9DP98_CAEBR|nr:hypothetical protein L3Y34_019880 [Caenorhabditis briggsae]
MTNMQHYMDDIQDLLDGLNEEMSKRLRKISKWEDQIVEKSPNLKRLENLVFDSSRPMTERSDAAHKLADLKNEIRLLSEKKTELAEKNHQTVHKIYEKLNELAYHCKCEVEIDNPGCTEQREREFFKSLDKNNYNGSGVLTPQSFIDSLPISGRNRKRESSIMTDDGQSTRSVTPFSGSRAVPNKKGPGRPRTDKRSKFKMAHFEMIPESSTVSSTRSSAEPELRTGEKRPKAMSKYMRKKQERLRQEEEQRARSVLFEVKKELDSGDYEKFAMNPHGEGTSSMAAEASTSCVDLCEEDEKDLLDCLNFSGLPSPPRGMMEDMDVSESALYSMEMYPPNHNASPEFRHPAASGSASASRSQSFTTQRSNNGSAAASAASSVSEPSIVGKRGGGGGSSTQRNTLFGSIADTSFSGRPRKLTDRVTEMINASREKSQIKKNSRDQEEWCICNGANMDSEMMVGCENRACEIQWFHFGCVGLLSPPEDEWYCPDCHYHSLSHNYTKMDHLDLEDDQREKLRQFTDITQLHDYDVAVGTLASLNWNLEQAIEAHLMQEDINDDDEDPEILETIPPRIPAASAPALQEEVIEVEPNSMPAARGRRRGRPANNGAASDERESVDNQIDDRVETRQTKKGQPIARRGRQPAEATPSSSSSSASSSAGPATRRSTRANPTPSEPSQPEPARQNGVLAASRQQQPPVAQAPMQDSDDDDDDEMIYEDDHNEPVRIDFQVARQAAVQNGRVPMIPDGYTSVPDALRNFVTVFSDRFCSTVASQAYMPPFFTDTLPNALKEAFENPNSELRRPLVFYINHDRSIAANIFASQVLCSEAVSSLIRHQYVLFPWDISSDSNLMHFMEFLQASNMADVRNMVQRLAMHKVENFPMMMVVVRERNTYRLVDYCKGTDTADQVLEKLLAGVEQYSSIRMNEAAERREREEREAIRNQQEAEYKASLAADKARMEAKQKEIEEQRLEEERKLKEEEDEALRRQLVASQLPDEPPASAPVAEIINVKFRLPEGGQDMRRFRRVESIQTLIDYLSSKGFSPDKYKYFNSDFPKKEITRHFDLSTNFTDSKWPAREQIFVEEI